MRSCKGWVILLFMFCFVIILTSKTFSEIKDTDRLVLMWQVQKNISDDDLALLRDKGVNLIQSYNVLFWSDEELRNYLDRAQKHGMEVVMSMTVLLKKTSSGFTFNFKRAESFINKWKEHPAVYAWEVFDEPSNKHLMVPTSFQEEIYNFIKGLNPGGRVFLTWNGVSKKQYECCFSEASFDVLDVHAYVVDKIGDRQRSQLRNLKNYRSGSYPLIITLRAFIGSNMPEILPDSLKKQYDFYFMENNLTRNVGFYGWTLGPNVGISQHQDLMRQFKELDIRIQK